MNSPKNCFTLILFCLSLALNAQNDCATAIILDSLEKWESEPYAYDMATVTFSNYSLPPCVITPSADFWFQFQPKKVYLHIAIDGAGTDRGNLNRPSIMIYKGDCTQLEEVKCIPGGYFGSATTVDLSNIDTNVTYYARIMGSEDMGRFGMRIQSNDPNEYAGQDCDMARLLTDFGPYEIFGDGNAGRNDREAEGTCLDISPPTVPIESNTNWFTWIADGEGTLAFDIIPANDSEDIDFVLYQMPTKSCNDIIGENVIRCMGAGGDHCVGPTGLNFTSTDVVEYIGCDPNNDNYLRYLDMESGMMYGLMINNFSSESSDFLLQFSGDGKFIHAKSENIVLNSAALCLDNELIVSAMGDTAISKYEWDFGEGATPNQATGVGPISVNYDAAGGKIVSLITSYKDGTFTNENYFIEVRDIPVIEGVTVRDSYCYGDKEGRVNVSMNAHYSFTYLWDNGSVSSSLKNVVAGEYAVHIAYAEIPECGIDTSFVIKQPNELSIENVQITPEMNGSDGGLSFDVTGGTPPLNFGLYDQSTGRIYQPGVEFDNLKSGEHILAVIDRNSCMDTVMVFVPSEIGVFEQTSMLKVYPNPIGDVFKVSIKSMSNLKVVDQLGRTVFQRASISTDIRINSADWVSGIYMLMVESDTGVTRTKLIK